MAIVTAFVPLMWQEFSYGADAGPSDLSISATISEEAMPVKIQVPQGQKEFMAPQRYSMSCRTTPSTTGHPTVSADFAFDALTGVGSIEGHHAFTLDTVAG